MADIGYALITGGAGFVGSNLADALLAGGERVVILDNLSRPGAERNAEWLKSRHGSSVRLEVADVTEADVVSRLVAGARQVFHLAGQVAVTTSIEDPGADLRTNLLGTFHVLEAARHRQDPPPVLFTSTNKVYGGLNQLAVKKDGDRYVFADGVDAIDESMPLDFHSPYGCSKGAADQYVRDYARIFDVPSVVFRMSCIYGRRQWGTEDQGWVAHFGRAILAGQPITIFGDGHQVRDILWIDDLVRAMRAALDTPERTAGQIFNVGGGPENAVTVRGVVDRLLAITASRTPVVMDDWRPGDQRVYISDNRKLKRALGWKPRVGSEEGLERLVAWLEQITGERMAPRDDDLESSSGAAVAAS
ncbi:MAG: GDP-mannose 4,6-dehydratase [Gemmatimonadota bacterium]